MKRIAVRARYPPELAHPIHRRLVRSEAASRMDLLMWGPTADVTTLSWFDADPEGVREVLAALGTLEAAHLVEGDGGTYAFLHQSDYEFPDAVLDLVARSRVVFLPPVTFLDDGAATFEALGESADLSAFYARLDDLLDVRIERVHEFSRGASSATTARQRAALDAALDAGYYDVPRTGSVEDVADELGCASSTAGELLRKAEAAVVSAYASRRGVHGTW